MSFSLRMRVLGSALMTAGLCVAGSVHATGADGLMVDRLIVKFKPEAASGPTARAVNHSARIQQLQQQANTAFQQLRTLRNGAVVLKLDQKKTLLGVQTLMSSIQQQSDVDYVEPDLRMVAKYTPTDPLYSQQWNYFEPTASVNAPGAWDVTKGAGSVVAVLDTGVRPHADLAGNLLAGYDFVSDASIGNDGNGRDSDPSDPGDWMAANECGTGDPAEFVASSWHGTHVAGTIAALAGNGIGGTGVAPQAKILPVRVLGKCGGYLSDIADAMVWAAGGTVSGVPTNTHPAKIINMSLGSPVPATCSRTYSDAIAAARAAGAMVVVAAGNENDIADNYPPANCAGVFAVAAVDRNGARAYYSNYGSVVDIAAPGGAQSYLNDPNGILSTLNAGSQSPGADSYFFYQGTSMATPHVAGVAALVWAAKPSATAAEVENALKLASRPFIGSCTGCGAGMVDATQAVGYITGTYTPPSRANLKLELVGDTGKFVANADDKNTGTVRYIARITNQGPAVPTTVSLVNAFPTGFTLQTATATQGSCNADATNCNLGGLAVGAQASVTLQFATQVKTKAQFTGSVSSEMLDADTSDNTVAKKFGGSLGAGLLALGALLARRRMKF